MSQEDLVRRYREQLVELSDLLARYTEGHWVDEIPKWIEDLDFMVSRGRYDILDKHARTTRSSLFGMSRISDIVFHPDYYPRVPRDPATITGINQRLQDLCSQIADTCDEILVERT